MLMHVQSGMTALDRGTFDYCMTATTYRHVNVQVHALVRAHAHVLVQVHAHALVQVQVHAPLQVHAHVLVQVHAHVHGLCIL